jgi:hypothetical protein
MKILEISDIEIMLTKVKKFGRTTLNLLEATHLKKDATNRPLKVDANLHIHLTKLETVDKLSLEKIIQVQIP